MNNKKLIAFDADDTLIQTIKTAFQVHKKTAEKYYGFEVTDKELKGLWGTSFEKFVKVLYEDVEPFEKIYRHLLQTKKEIPVDPHVGAIKTLDSLKEEYLIGLVTSNAWEIARLYLKEGGFDLDIFDWFQTEEDTDCHKPNGKVFKPMFKFAKKRGIKQDEILYVGDSIQDYMATQDAGIDFVAVTTGFTTKDEFIKAGLDKQLIMKQIDELPNIILN